METKEFKLQLKDVDDVGHFVGKAAVYGNVDLQGDKIQAGAFNHTLKMLGGEVPVLWHHRMDNPIGQGKLQDRSGYLEIQGQLNLDINLAREVHSLMRLREGFKKPAVSGLSIGYESVKADFVDGARVLKEIKLYEVSLVTIPANPRAQVSRVKRYQDMQELLTTMLREIAAIKASLKAEGIVVDPDLDQSLRAFEFLRPGGAESDPPYGSLADPNEDAGQSLDQFLGDAKTWIERLKHGGSHSQGASR